MGGHRERTSNSQGSWFPSGYYGHFRSKHRNDFLNQYRQQSKPSPPQKFHDMVADRPTHHHFSHHDNRFSFLNTVTSFEGNLGKKKVQTNKFVPDFIAWVPHQREIQAAGPKVSIYRDTYNGVGEPDRVPQILVPSVRRPGPPEQSMRPLIKAPYLDQKTAEEEREPISTTYRLTHQHCQPNRLISTDMNTGMIEQNEPVPEQKTMSYINPKVASIHESPAPSMTRIRRSRVASAPLFRSSVAECMVWHSHNGSESVTVIPQEPPRPKTAMGLLPEISNSDANNNTQQDSGALSHSWSQPAHSSRFGITPYATPTVPMETMHTSPSQPAPPDTISSLSHVPSPPVEAPQATVCESL